jgi:hypothetical protein
MARQYWFSGIDCGCVAANAGPEHFLHICRASAAETSPDVRFRSQRGSRESLGGLLTASGHVACQCFRVQDAQSEYWKRYCPRSPYVGRRTTCCFALLRCSRWSGGVRQVHRPGVASARARCVAESIPRPHGCRALINDRLNAHRGESTALRETSGSRRQLDRGGKMAEERWERHEDHPV